MRAYVIRMLSRINTVLEIHLVTGRMMYPVWVKNWSI